ncbi:exocyst complex component 1-like protein [Dinothrombium tinctorium]|uniref:Exocyst complex component 1-like protein n=1 Tax=Dinothrombium tinctorium TaxID=1965070 RepID=A0A3S3PUI3_9ACAR|nr:exocyst complex component 1-like protein [Dinothrombium tinctorium]RWS16639.1 exocyst complex component 1-like protein [Dinothrombium tinctorium]
MEESDENGLKEESYQALTSREESDLERLMAQCEFTINNTEAFTEKLSRELSSMDSSNIQSIMASEQKVENLMKVLQCSIDEVAKLEQRIEHYQNLLKNVRDIVLQVEQKEALVQTQNDNNQKLLSELQSLINELEFPPDKERNLFETDLTKSNGITLCLIAANSLQECLQANIHPALRQMNAVREQQRYLEQIQARFCNRLYTQMNEIFDSLVAQYADRLLQSMNSKDLALCNHEVIHNALMPYSPLIKLLKPNSDNTFSAIQNSYLNKMKPLYENEITHYFDLVKEKLSGGKLTIGSSDSFDGRKKNQEGSRMRSSSFQGTGQEFLDSSSSKSSDISLSEWEEFDSCIERMLSTIDPVCLYEQRFCISFFDIDSVNVQHTTESGHRRSSSIGSQNYSISPSPSNLSQNSSELSDVKKAESLRRLMSQMFLILEQEFVKFISNYDRLDGLYSMYLLVRLSQHVLSTQDAGSFLAKTYGNILIHVKRNFDKFMQSQVTAIEETKAPKKPKCGVFPFIKKFEQFAKQAEGVFKVSASRRTDIDRWYVTLCRSMFDTINRLSDTHHKTPPEMVRLENYHYLHDVLCTLKIACLESEKREAKQRYNEALKDYVARYFGRPLEKLNTFFEGVQMKVAQGVKQDEVGYQLAFSKQELRKVINSCTLKDIKKGLEEMYRKVEKHTCDPDSTLIQVSKTSAFEKIIY